MGSQDWKPFRLYLNYACFTIIVVVHITLMYVGFDYGGVGAGKQTNAAILGGRSYLSGYRGGTDLESFIIMLLRSLYTSITFPIVLSQLSKRCVIKQWAAGMAIWWHNMNAVILPFWMIHKNYMLFPEGHIINEDYIYLNKEWLMHVGMTIVCWVYVFSAEDRPLTKTIAGGRGA